MAIVVTDKPKAPIRVTDKPKPPIKTYRLERWKTVRKDTFEKAAELRAEFPKGTKLSHKNMLCDLGKVKIKRRGKKNKTAKADYFDVIIFRKVPLKVEGETNEATPAG